MANVRTPGCVFFFSPCERGRSEVFWTASSCLPASVFLYSSYSKHQLIYQQCFVQLSVVSLCEKIWQHLLGQYLRSTHFEQKNTHTLFSCVVLEHQYSILHLLHEEQRQIVIIYLNQFLLQIPGYFTYSVCISFFLSEYNANYSPIVVSLVVLLSFIMLV